MDPLQSALYSVWNFENNGRNMKKCNAIEMELEQSSSSDQGLKLSPFGLIQSLISVSVSIGRASRSTEKSLLWAVKKIWKPSSHTWQCK